MPNKYGRFILHLFFSLGIFFGDVQGTGVLSAAVASRWIVYSDIHFRLLIQVRVDFLWLPRRMHE